MPFLIRDSPHPNLSVFRWSRYSGKTSAVPGCPLYLTKAVCANLVCDVSHGIWIHGVLYNRALSFCGHVHCSVPEAVVRLCKVAASRCSSCNNVHTQHTCIRTCTLTTCLAYGLCWLVCMLVLHVCLLCVLASRVAHEQWCKSWPTYFKCCVT